MVGNIVGPPGAGKTTQGTFIQNKYCICLFETGPISRRNALEGTPFGKLVIKYQSFSPDDKSIEYL